MLRDLAGDPALSAALRAYYPAAGCRSRPRPELSRHFEKLIDEANSSSRSRPASRRDLSWFFSDWVDADKGLPDIAIDSVFPSHTEGDNWLVAVNLSNSGYAAAEIPVTVSNPLTSVTQRVLVPARGKATQRILMQGQPTQVQANDGTVPETEASVHIRDLDGAGSDPSSSPPIGAPQ